MMAQKFEYDHLTRCAPRLDDVGSMLVTREHAPAPGFGGPPGRWAGLLLLLPLACAPAAPVLPTPAPLTKFSSPPVPPKAAPTAPEATPPAQPVAKPIPDVAEPAPEPPPIPVAERTTVTYAELLDELRRVADELTEAPEVQRSYHALLADYALTPDDVSLQSYSRVRLVFEATRDGGFWGVRWDITDRMPWSDAVWQQWRERDWTGEPPEITAVAECDELSALFAFLTRDLGVQGFVGLFWPTWNHTVAVWEVRRGATETNPGERVRILVPTSQVWLSREATLGTREFKTNRVVFPYQRQDLKPDSELPAAVARYLVERTRRYGALSNEQLLERRNHLGGS